MRTLSFDAACRLADAWPGRICPATLHPAYVAADARRCSALDPLFLCFESGGERWLHSLHSTRIRGTDWRDASSPYGYGGPLATSDDPGFLSDAWEAHATWMREAGVVVEYLRFHPLVANERGYTGQVQDNRDVVWIELAAPDLLRGYSVRTRQAVRKAGAAGLVYSEQPLATLAAAFGAFHRQAMRSMGTDPFYVFDDTYFQALGRMPHARLGVCTAADAQDWLAAALFLDGFGVREYHLAATAPLGRTLGAASLLLHEAGLRARAAGMHALYLGGGTDTLHDNPLLFFKAGFSTMRARYRTGSAVFLPQAYEELGLRFATERRAHPLRAIFHRKV